MSNLDKVKKLLHDAKQMAQQKRQMDVVQKMIQDAVKQQLQSFAPQARKGLFNTSIPQSDEPSAQKLNKLLLDPNIKDDQTVEFRKMCDNLYILSVLTGRPPQSLNYYKQLANHPLVKDAYSTADFNWIPPSLSQELIKEVELELKVAALHKVIDMPTNPFLIPGKSGRTKVYLVPESTDVPGNEPPTSADVTVSPQVSLNAQKLMAYVPVSEETEEDVLLPIMDIIKDDIKKAFAEALENAIINGQTAGHTIDTQAAIPANDPRRAWDGYRCHALNNNWTIDLSSWDLSQPYTNVRLLRAMRSVARKYGANSDELAWVVSIVGGAHMMTIPEVITPDKYGDKATILKGEIGKFDNIPIILSEFVSDSLNANGAYTSDTDNIYTTIILVYAPGFVRGRRSQFTLKQGEEIRTDQRYLVARERLDFKPRYYVGDFADSVVVVGYGLTTVLAP